MTPDLYWLCPTFAACAGTVFWIVRHKNAIRVKNRILRDLVGLQTLWEETDPRLSPLPPARSIRNSSYHHRLAA
jgi:hypothetical protein